MKYSLVLEYAHGYCKEPEREFDLQSMGFETWFTIHKGNAVVAEVYKVDSRVMPLVDWHAGSDCTDQVSQELVNMAVKFINEIEDKLCYNMDFSMSRVSAHKYNVKRIA